MKARNRKTGEVVSIISHNVCSSIRSSQDYVSYIDSKDVEHDRESLNYYWDFEPIDDNSDHWQDVRERAAIAAIQAFCAAPVTKDTESMTIDDATKFAVEIADALVEKLKGK